MVNNHKSGKYIPSNQAFKLTSIFVYRYSAATHMNPITTTDSRNRSSLNEERYKSIITVSNTGAWEYHVNSGFLWCSPAYFDMLGYDADGFDLSGNPNLKENWIDLLHPEDREKAANHFAEYLKGNVPGMYENHFRLRHKNGSWIWIWSRGQTLRASDGKLTDLTVGTHIDITKTKQQEEDIRKSNERFEIVTLATNDVIWDWDLATGDMWWNEHFYRVFMLDKNKVKPDIRSWYDGLHPDDLDRVKNSLLKTVEQGSHYWSEEYRFLKSNGEVVEIFDRGYMIYDAGGKPCRMIGSMFDMTDRKRAQEASLALEQEISRQKIQQQKNITRAVIRAQEKERNRIGQELHDNVCQILIGTKMHLEIAAEKDESIARLIQQPVALVEDAIQEIRSLCKKNITPLKDIDLQSELQSLIDSFGSVSKTNTVFEYDIPPIVSDDLKLNIYRIVQEQISNIVKHAAAENVVISMRLDENVLYVVVSDDGKGFDIAKRRSGIGISNIINRVESFNGEVSIESSPGKGCRTEIRIPYS